MRVDVERHFEGIPRLSIRDYVSTERPTENERSINFIRKHAHKLPLASMKMTDKSLVKAIRNNMANIGDMMDGGIGQLLKSGSGMGLGELAAGLSGQIGSPGLIENINKYGGTLMRGGSSIGNIIGTFT